MNDLTQSRTASVLTILLGGWLCLSPLFISITGAALVSLFVVGGVMIASGLVQLFTENSLPSWLTGLAAIYLVVSAFAFSVSNNVAWNEVISGMVAFVLALWDGLEITQVHDRHIAGTL